MFATGTVSYVIDGIVPMLSGVRNEPIRRVLSLNENLDFRSTRHTKIGREYFCGCLTIIYCMGIRKADIGDWISLYIILSKSIIRPKNRVLQSDTIPEVPEYLMQMRPDIRSGSATVCRSFA